MEKGTKMIIGAAGALVGAAVASVLLTFKYRRTIPEGAEAVKPFDISRYMGQWYEIARMPMSYEKHVHYVTANYSLRGDGSVKVVNQGFNEKKGIWQKATGRAVFAGDPQEAKLKVSFFGPFYAGYNVIDIDEDYQYALVFGRNLDYMWILSREKEIPEMVLRRFLEKADSFGYDLYRLIWTEQEF